MLLHISLFTRLSTQEDAKQRTESRFGPCLDPVWACLDFVISNGAESAMGPPEWSAMNENFRYSIGRWAISGQFRRRRGVRPTPRLSIFPCPGLRAMKTAPRAPWGRGKGRRRPTASAHEDAVLLKSFHPPSLIWLLVFYCTAVIFWNLKFAK